MAVRHLRGLLDTSVVASLGGLANGDALSTRSFASAITLAEVSAGLLVAKTDRERIARQSVLQQVEADGHAVPFDDRSARASGRVAAELRGLGSQDRRPCLRCASRPQQWRTSFPSSR